MAEMNLGAEDILDIVNIKTINSKEIHNYLINWNNCPDEYNADTCTVCAYFLKQVSSELLVDLIKKINKLGKQVPENLFGVLVMRVVMQSYLGISEREMMLFDPVSIFFHVILGCCRSDTNGHPMASFIRSTVVFHSRWDNASAENRKKLLRQQKEMLSYYTASLKNKKGCRGGMCLFADTGLVNTVMESFIFPDSRSLVNPKWVEDNNKGSFEHFLSSSMYKKEQPGVDISSLMKHNNTNPVSGIQYFGEMDELNSFTYHIFDRLMDNTVALQKHKDDLTSLSLRIETINMLYNLVKEIEKHIKKNSLLYIFVNVFSTCHWCCLCLVKQMRGILNDVLVMSKTAMFERGIGCESNHHITFYTVDEDESYKSKKTTEAINEGSTQFSLCFSKFDLMKQAFDTVVHHWWHNKFAGVSKILPNLKQEDLYEHLCPSQNLKCKINIRKMYTETDLKQKNDLKMCAIPYAIDSAIALLEKGVKMQKDLNSVRSNAQLHKLHVREPNWNYIEEEEEEEEDIED